jgi:hypothetical protein
VAVLAKDVYQDMEVRAVVRRVRIRVVVAKMPKWRQGRIEERVAERSGKDAYE